MALRVPREYGLPEDVPSHNRLNMVEKVFDIQENQMRNTDSIPYLSLVLCVVAGSATSLTSATSTHAAEIAFTINPLQTQVSVLGHIAVLDAPMEPQGSGSDVAAYGGTFLVDVDDPLAPTTISFLGGSAAAEITGDWLPEVGGGSPGNALPGNADPGDPQPANYGLQAEQFLVGNIWVAFRDLALSPTSTALAVSDGTFAPNQLFTVGSGSADYTVRSVIFSDMNDHMDLVGKEAANVAQGSGSYLVENGTATLRFPVELLVEVEDEENNVPLLALTFTGNVTATAVLAPSPTADIDGDGDVDGHDLLDMLVGFGTADGATLADGDADSDGDVDRADVQVWRSQVGSAAPAGLSSAAVPEPSSGILTLFAAGVVLAAGCMSPRGRRSRVSS